MPCSASSEKGCNVDGKPEPLKRIGIDASNIRGGGGVTHLAALLSATEPACHGIGRVVVWGGAGTLARLPNRDWLEKAHEPLLDGGVVSRLAWQRFHLSGLAGKSCDLLFIPGGNYAGSFRPYVAMSQNLLPFTPEARRRYGTSRKRFRLWFLSKGQASTFRRADGMIFLTNAARSRVENEIGRLASPVAVIPHGIEEEFRQAPRPQLPMDAYSRERPFRWLYVSVIELYKHQTAVTEAVAMLRREGFPLALDLVGPAYPAAMKRLNGVIRRLDPAGEAIRYHGPVSHDRLSVHYRNADAFIFASSCENMPIILMEAMAAGLPIASSRVPPMPEVLGPRGLYFDPENPEEIAGRLREAMSDPKARERLATDAFERSEPYTWEKCARETFSFMASLCPRSRAKEPEAAHGSECLGG